MPNDSTMQEEGYEDVLKALQGEAEVVNMVR